MSLCLRVVLSQTFVLRDTSFRLPVTLYRLGSMNCFSFLSSYSYSAFHNASIAACLFIKSLIILPIYLCRDCMDSLGSYLLILRLHPHNSHPHIPYIHSSNRLCQTFFFSPIYDPQFGQKFSLLEMACS